MGVPEVLMEGVAFGESPRWHDGRVWFSDWDANGGFGTAAAAAA